MQQHSGPLMVDVTVAGDVVERNAVGCYNYTINAAAARAVDDDDDTKSTFSHDVDIEWRVLSRKCARKSAHVLPCVI
jgi:hypothetical protein